jgi:ParB family transcriptional regulator, chromosome partitioning protein
VTDVITEPAATESAIGPIDPDQHGPGLEGEQSRELEYTERPMIPVELLTAHPGNVREDKQADQTFCRSVATAGIIVPLEITVDPGGGYRVVDGNIRLDAACKVGLEAVPYFFSADTADDEGLQYLHMLISSRFRKNLSVHEEAAALFEASKMMTKTEIRKATGLSAAEVKAGIRAGSLNHRAKELAAEMDYEWTLEELALLKPFENDPDAMEVIGRNRYSPLKYTVQRLLDEREAKARRAKMVAELEEAGVTVTADRPAGAVALHHLMNGEEQMTAEAHASCPGAVAGIPSWSNATPNFYCMDPAEHGHVFAETGTTSPSESAVCAPAPLPEPTPSSERRIVIEGNKAWEAAGKVRQAWLEEFLARKTAPRNVAGIIARFVTEQIVTMPEPLCRALGGVRHSQMFASFGGPTPDTVAKSALPGLWMIALVSIAAAYEREITGDGERRNTWREDRYSPCSREDAGEWLRLVAEIGAKHGYEPSPIERAVADGVAYRGDDPAEDLTEENDIPEDDTEDQAVEPRKEHDGHPDEQAPQEPQDAEPAAVPTPAEPADPTPRHDPVNAAPTPQVADLAACVADGATSEPPDAENAERPDEVAKAEEHAEAA